MNSKQEIIIRIKDNETITMEQIGRVKMPPRPILPEQIAKVFLNSMEDAIDEWEYQSPVLPPCICHGKYADGTMYMVLQREKHRRDIKYEKSVFKDVGIPNLILGIGVKNSEIIRTKLAAVIDLVITPESQIYHYPFSNVYSNFNICWGTYQMHRIEHLYQLTSLIDVFLSLEMNNDLYTNPKPYRQLLEELEGKDFNDSMLRPAAGYNFERFWQELPHSY